VFCVQELQTIILILLRWYIFNRGKIRISLWFNEFFSFRCVGSTYLTVVAWCGRLVELPMFISSTQHFAFQSCNFFLEGSWVLLFSYFPCY